LAKRIVAARSRVEIGQTTDSRVNSEVQEVREQAEGMSDRMQFKLMNLLAVMTALCFVAALVTLDVARFALWLPLALLCWHLYHFGRELKQWP
jgi:energy-converting hydrogenase Eha subunit H